MDINIKYVGIGLVFVVLAVSLFVVANYTMPLKDAETVGKYSYEPVQILPTTSAYNTGVTYEEVSLADPTHPGGGL